MGFKTCPLPFPRLLGTKLSKNKAKKNNNNNTKLVEDNLPSFFDFLIAHASYSVKTKRNTVNSSFIQRNLPEALPIICLITYSTNSLSQ